MQIKKFRASTLKDAMNEMKEILGSDAIVLSTQVIEGDASIGMKKMFEITAGIEDEILSDPKPSAAKKSKKKEINFEEELKKLTKKIYGEKSKSVKKKKADKPVHLKKTGKALNAEYVKEISDLLKHREVEDKIIDKVMEHLEKYAPLLNSSNLDSYVTSIISSLIPTSNFEIKKGKKPTIVSLVGPTGVGKTTCIAKLAVISKILHNLDVGLISIDTYRLGALDQLKIFAEISDIDFFVAYEPADMPKLVSKMKKKDLIFIDTVGRSQNKPFQLKGIKDFLDTVKIDENYLVLSSIATTRNLIDVAKKFKVLDYNGLIFSKLDEAIGFGNLMNIASTFNVPIKYLTNGQVIPDDIIAADPDFIANMIYTGKITQ